MASLQAGRFIGRVSSLAPDSGSISSTTGSSAIARWSGAGQETLSSTRSGLKPGTAPSQKLAVDRDRNRQRRRNARLALIPLILRVQSRRPYRRVRRFECDRLQRADLESWRGARCGGGALDVQALVAALRKVPGGADLIRLRKMPGGQLNPLAVLGRSGSSSLNGNIIAIGDDFEAYRTSIKRKQLPRNWRVFLAIRARRSG